MQKNTLSRFPLNIIVNLLLVYVCYEVCRVAFLLENWGAFKDSMDFGVFLKLHRGSLLFDTSAIFYTNSLYLLLALLPLHHFPSKVVRQATRWSFLLPNILCIVLNLMDSAYFSFTEKRIMANVFSEFDNETNLGGIIGIEVLHHWYFVVLALVLGFGLFRLYRHEAVRAPRSLWRLLVVRLVVLVVTIPFIVCAMRGALFATATRPISVNNARQFVEQPLQANIVLNTPFSLIRTMDNRPVETPQFFSDPAELDRIYSPVHMPDSTRTPNKKNVVILIVESYAMEFIGSLNRDLDGGTYKGYTTFADSLIQHAVTFEESFCNSWTSIDAMPAVLAGIPKMFNPFVLTPYSLNRLTSLPGELGRWGYETAFFHGAENSSMGFHAFANSVGYQHYFGRTEYEADRQYGGRNDFDGTWGIWDEPFLQYFCHKMTGLHEPFMASVFTLSSHHPFRIPDKYKDKFKDEGIHQLHKCIRYTDNALRRFFDTARQQPWYKNTIFVITADHASSKTTHAEYKTELGHFRIPIIIYDPSGELEPGQRPGIVQQIDIMPTILDYLGYDKPYIAFGQDMLRTRPEDTWAFNWNSIPQLVKGQWLMQLDNNEVKAVYDYKHDRLLQHNLKGHVREQRDMELLMKAIMQSYQERMKANNVTYDNNTAKP